MYFISNWLAAVLKTEKALDFVTFSLSPDNWSNLQIEKKKCKARPKAQVCPADFKYRFQNLRRINWNTRLINQMLTNKTRHVSFKAARNQLYDPLIILQKHKILGDFKEIYYADQKRQQALFDTIHNFLLTPPFSLFVFLLFPSSEFFLFSSPKLLKYIFTHIMLFHSIKQYVIILSTSCWQTFEAAIPPSCLVIADHLSCQ